MRLVRVKYLSPPYTTRATSGVESSRSAQWVCSSSVWGYSSRATSRSSRFLARLGADPPDLSLPDIWLVFDAARDAAPAVCGVKHEPSRSYGHFLYAISCIFWCIFVIYTNKYYVYKHNIIWFHIIVTFVFIVGVLFIRKTRHFKTCFSIVRLIDADWYHMDNSS